MLTIHPEFVVDQEDKKKAVVVSLAEWQQLMEAVEELEEIRAYDKAKSRPEGVAPFEHAVRQIKARAKR